LLNGLRAFAVTIDGREAEGRGILYRSAVVKPSEAREGRPGPGTTSGYACSWVAMTEPDVVVRRKSKVYCGEGMVATILDCSKRRPAGVYVCTVEV
jgi:hypothetical protein